MLIDDISFSPLPASPPIQQVFHADLPGLGLVIKETPNFIRSSRVALLRLSDQGRQAFGELGWPVVESEWDRLIYSHEGLLYPRHTLGLLAFCWQARLRGLANGIAAAGECISRVQ